MASVEGAAPAGTASGTPAKLYVISGSHACRTAMLTLGYKRVPYRVVELPTGLHSLAVRLLGFPGRATRTVDGRAHPALATLDRLGTVPALRHDGRRIQTNRAITAYLERIVPDPPLYPADPARRAEVEQAALFGDEQLQMPARRIALAAGVGGLDALHERAGAGRLGPLLARSTPQRVIVNAIAARVMFRAAGRDSDLIEELRPMLDRLDAWWADGVIGGEQPNAADFAIAPSLALLDYRLDLREELRARPCFALVERLLPA
jgi:glutathione S-transferase